MARAREVVGLVEAAAAVRADRVGCSVPVGSTAETVVLQAEVGWEPVKVKAETEAGEAVLVEAEREAATKARVDRTVIQTAPTNQQRMGGMRIPEGSHLDQHG